MTGPHEARLRAAVAHVRDADILSEMAVGWRTAISRIKVSEKHLQQVLTGLEEHEQLGPRTREAAAASLTGMAEHLREQRRVLRGTAQALDVASAAMGTAVRLVESWDRGGAPVEPGPAPQPDPQATDQSPYLTALSAHTSAVTTYDEAFAQREDAARREMENLQETFSHAEQQIRVHHDIPRSRLTQEQQKELRRQEIERQRELERQRDLERQREQERQRELERQRDLERQREQERQRELERQRDLDRQREQERQRELERQRERDVEQPTRPTSSDPGRRDYAVGVPTSTHTGISHLAGSSGPALITSVSAEAQSGLALAGPQASSSAALTGGTGAAIGPASMPGGLMSAGLMSGPSVSVGGAPGSAPVAGAAGGAARAARPGAAPAAAGQTGRGGAPGGSLGGAAGARAGGGSGAQGRRARRTQDDKGERPELMSSDSDWVGDDDAAPGVLG